MCTTPDNFDTNGRTKMWRAVILFSLIFVGTNAGDKVRSVGVGSVPYNNGEIFFPSNAKTAATIEPVTNSKQMAQDRLKLFQALSCLNVGSSAKGVFDGNFIDMGNGVYPTALIQHLLNCSVPTPMPTAKPGTGGNGGNGNNNYTVCESEADIVFLLDSSGSVGPTDFQTMLTFVESVVGRFTVGSNNVQIGVDTFDSTVRTEFNLDTYNDTSSVQAAIANISYRGGQTNIAQAISFVVNDSFSASAGHRAGVKKVAVIITDGGSDDKVLTLEKAKEARDSGVLMFAVGVGDTVDQAELEGIANKPSTEFVVNAANFSDLQALTSTLSARTCKGNATGTIILNGTASGTGSSAGGGKTTSPPDSAIQTTTAPINLPSLNPGLAFPTPSRRRTVIGKSKKSYGVGSSAGEYGGACKFFCPPNQTGTSGTGTGSGTGGKNGTASGTGSSTGHGTTVAPGTGTGTGTGGTGTGGTGTGGTGTGGTGTGGTGTGGTGTGTGTGTGSGTGGTGTKTNNTEAGTGSTTNTGGTGTNTTGTGTGTGTGTQTGTGTGTNTGTGTGTGTNTGTGTGNGTQAGTGSQTGPGTTMMPGSGTNTGTGNGSGGGSTIQPSTSGQLPDLNNLDNLNHTGECVDLVDCRVYPKNKICGKDSVYRPWAEVRCKVYCEFCDPHTSPVPCVDKIPNCHEYDADLCTNPLFRLFREDNCSKFCALCQSPTTAVTI